MRLSPCLALLFAALLSGCAHRAPEYPIGLYAVFKAEDMPTVAGAGFNHILGKLEAPLLDAALSNNVAVFADPASRLPDFRPAGAQHAVRKFDRHPALAGWYIVDEPDLHNIPPSQVQTVHSQLKRFGARKPTVVVLGTGLAAADYARLGDISMLDRYPVNTRPLATFGQHLRQVRLARGAERPLYAIIQAFNWRYYTNHVTGNPERLRPPSESEIRCMTYLALVERANGVFYYCWDDGKWVMREQPATWDALKNVVAEVREREALFQGRHTWFAHEVEYLSSPRLNEAGEPSISLAFLEVSAESPLMGKGHYLVAVNTTPGEVRARIKLPAPPVDELYVLGESRIAAMDANGAVTESFKPHEVHVYGPLGAHGETNDKRGAGVE